MDLRRSADTLATRVRAFELLMERSYAEGNFVLASGKTSKFYLDMKPTMLDPEGANLLAELVIEQIMQLEERIDFVGGLAMGAVPLVSVVSAISANKQRKFPAFIVRKEAKDHGTKRIVETAGDLKGKNVVILDDVTTSGESAMLAVEAARAAGAKVVLVLAIVDREEGAVDFYKRQGIPFRSLFRLSEFRLAAHAA